MSAALQFSGYLAASASWPALRTESGRSEQQKCKQNPAPSSEDEKLPVITLAFYRKHTETLLRRYLYASMLVGRTPSMLEHTMGQGSASSRPVHTFEDAVNFVLDLEACLAHLNALDRYLLKRVVLQEYTVSETADMLGLALGTITTRMGVATDRLTRILLKEGLLVLPQ